MRIDVRMSWLYYNWLAIFTKDFVAVLIGLVYRLSHISKLPGDDHSRIVKVLLEVSHR